MPGRVNVLLIGDSLTQQAHCGWAGSLADWFARKGDVTNRGYSGYTSSWVLLLYRRELANFHWAADSSRNVLTILLGANDASRGEDDLRYVPVEVFAENLRQMIALAREAAPGVRVVLITPPRVDSDQWEGRSDEHVGKYAEAVRMLAAVDDGCVLVDLWEELPDCPSVVKEDLWDGLHFGPTGHAKVFKKLQSAMTKAFPDIDPTWRSDGSCALDQHFPDWRAMVGKSSTEVEAMMEAWTWSHGGCPPRE